MSPPPFYIVISTDSSFPSIRDSQKSSPGGKKQNPLVTSLSPSDKNSREALRTTPITIKLWNPRWRSETGVWFCSSRKSCLKNTTWDSRHLMTPIGIHARIQTVTYAHCKFCFREKWRLFKWLLLCTELSTYRNAILIFGKLSAKLTWVVSEYKCPKLLNTYFIRPGNQEVIDFCTQLIRTPLFIIYYFGRS